jgi:hypothetical protein
MSRNIIFVWEIKVELLCGSSLESKLPDNVWALLQTES